MALVFDPDGPASSGLFGLPHSPDEAHVVALPVPVDVTTSSGGGTASAPARLVEASWQVDLHDLQTGEPWRHGFAMDQAPACTLDASCPTRATADRARAGDPTALAAINAFGEQLNEAIEEWTGRMLDTGKIPAVVGGDHSVPLGAFRAAIRRFPGLGILHIDAHADLRQAYEGFTYSHASIFYNALQEAALGPVVQVGIRDVGTREIMLSQAEDRVHLWTDFELTRCIDNGESFRALCQRIIAPLPPAVWISWDVDGLDPTLCPATGTPVPGGLTWRQAMTLLEVLGRSGRRIVGFDLCEVGDADWDANVGARLLYKLSGWAIASQREIIS